MTVVNLVREPRHYNCGSTHNTMSERMQCDEVFAYKIAQTVRCDYFAGTTSIVPAQRRRKESPVPTVKTVPVTTTEIVGVPPVLAAKPLSKAQRELKEWRESHRECTDHGRGIRNTIEMRECDERRGRKWYGQP